MLKQVTKYWEGMTMMLHNFIRKLGAVWLTLLLTALAMCLSLCLTLTSLYIAGHKEALAFAACMSLLVPAVLVPLLSFTFFNLLVRFENSEVEKEKLIHELQEALQKVKKLKGLLPICASCKKIRDDAGYWHQVEDYVHQHSDVVFSHGICPDCAKQLYPGYFMNKDNERLSQAGVGG
ncbi:MAG TPA: hypothetical protein PLP19_11835 [bacterium]|mgnify:CR=1 FL=1|nr:hypothetical protein [bacterium]HPN44172.1 hypothetical protein [bacterium]